ncbi:MAG: hypothetical protein RMK18_12560 [Armatimonadota bacterium]|nr:hypothetical protein [Armatimonadota bacterium]
MDGQWVYGNPIVLTMESDHSLVAVFEPPQTRTLTISVEGPGWTEPYPDTYTYILGSQVTVSAHPYWNCTFVGWKLDGQWVYGNPIVLTMESDHSLVAVFEPPQTRTLTISVQGNGTTSPLPGTYSYFDGTVLTVHAQSHEYWEFSNWLLDGV